MRPTDAEVRVLPAVEAPTGAAPAALRVYTCPTASGCWASYGLSNYGIEGQDRVNYTDTQDRESYVPDEGAEDEHSVNCYFCGRLFDERDGVDADTMNGGDGGTACPECAKERGDGN